MAYLFFVASLYGVMILLSDGEVRYFHEDFALGFTSYNEASELSEEERTRQLRPLALTFILLSIPILSLISRLIYRRAGFNFAEHLVIYAYYMGQLLLLNLMFYLVILLFPLLEGSSIFNNIFGLFFLGYAWVLQIQTFQLQGVWKGLSPLFFVLIMVFVTGLMYGLSAEFLIEQGIEVQ